MRKGSGYDGEEDGLAQKKREEDGIWEFGTHKGGVDRELERDLEEMVYVHKEDGKSVAVDLFFS